jgi:hypothetical protein
MMDWRTQMIVHAVLTGASALGCGAAAGVGETPKSMKALSRGQDATPVLINGQFGPGEWDEGGVLTVEGRLRITVSQDRYFVYLGIRFLRDMHTGIDLYVAAPGRAAKKLHVSAAIGEAEQVSGVWGEIQWGKNSLWSANSIGLIAEGGKQEVVPLEGFEFQISKAMLAGQTWRLFLHLKRPELKYPEGATADDAAGWIEVTM